MSEAYCRFSPSLHTCGQPSKYVDGAAAEEVPDLSMRLCDDCGVVPEGVFPMKVAKQVEQAPCDITDARFVSCVFHFDMLTLIGGVCSSFNL